MKKDKKVKTKCLGQIVHIELPAETGQPCMLALNLGTRTLSLLHMYDTGPRMIAQEQFRQQEIRILHALISCYPLCSYAQLLAYFHKEAGEAPTDEEIASYRVAIEQNGVQLVNQARNMVSRVRIKLNTFGFEILTVLENGYQLEYAGEVVALGSS